jgi:hypothetical protein
MVYHDTDVQPATRYWVKLHGEITIIVTHGPDPLRPGSWRAVNCASGRNVRVTAADLRNECDDQAYRRWLEKRRTGN